MTWIRVIAPDEADGRLGDLYGQVAGPDGQVDRILQAHGLRPHTLRGHLELYKAVLHHSANTLGRATLELLGVFVSHWNGCVYCREHHFAGMAREIADTHQVDAIRRALDTDELAASFPERERALLQYARKLTREPGAMVEDDLAAMRAAGLTDGEILEANQVVAYFQYANRTVTGLGVRHEGEALGLAPSNQADERDWSHR